MTENPQDIPKRITIIKDGPYIVRGRVPFVKLTQICSDRGEPLDWQFFGDQTPEGETYLLCRCGKSSTWPFCDGTHKKINFDGTEVARTDRESMRQVTYKGDGLIVKKDISLCMQSGFCVLTDTSVSQLTYNSKDEIKRDRAIKMVFDCPAGSLTCQLPGSEKDLEPDLPKQIAETIEITSYGPIRAPIWVMGYLPILRSDGVPFIPRNRVTLCTCGLSRNKPLCDGTHRYVQERELRRKHAAGQK